MWHNIILAAYGLLLLVGGYFGIKKGSKVSFIMGLVSGLVVFYGLYLLPYHPQAWMLLSGVSGLLTLVFLLRLMKTKKFMPSGMLLTVSLLVLFYCLKHLKW